MIEQDELLASFIEESRQHLNTIEPDLLGLEQGGDDVDQDVVNRVFRGIHSIKGASGFFGLRNIGKLSHVMENILSLLRNGKILPDSNLIDALLAGLDALKAMVEDLGASEQIDISEETDTLQKILDTQGTSGRRRKVAVSENGVGEPDKGDINFFNVDESELETYVARGYHLYTVSLYLKDDLASKGKTPFDFINNMISLGQYIDSFLDTRVVSGLSDCLDFELPFSFLFATILEPDLVPKGLDIPEDRVKPVNLDAFRSRMKKCVPKPPAVEKTDSEKAEAPVEPEPKPPAQAHPSEESEKPGTIPAVNNQKGKEAFPIQTEEKIRVGVRFLNDLVNLAGELVLGRNQLMQTALPLVKDTPGLNAVLQHISRVTSEMQEKIMQMRMQPISLVFGKFQRVVRSLAKSLNKEVRLETEDRGVELDKTIIEGLSDPLTHLIRNAIDHGIEPPGEREKAGKSRYGTIELKASHQGGLVNLEVIDDGKGVDGDMIGQKAFAAGLVSKDRIDGMNEKELVRLVFHPGFSTAEKVTSVSGRGVGMDVVITNIERLGGTVDIETKKGTGTKVTLALPLTLAIVSGLLIKSGNQYFILPEVDIDELVRIKPEEIEHRIDVVQNASVLRLREMLLPLVNLNAVLGISCNDGQICGDRSKPLRIIVAKYGTSRFGIIVDDIVSIEEIVVKPLPRYLKKMKCFSGVSILGNGTVSLILDIPGIVKKAEIDKIKTEGEDAGDARAVAVEQEEQTLLLFDNNTEEKFAVPLELIARIERVGASGIERIRDNRYIQYHKQKLRLIFLEDYLPVTRPERSPEDAVGVIVPKQTQHPVGIVINKVINTVSTVVELDTTAIMAPGLFGSAVIEGKITLFPDMYHLFKMAAPEWHAPEEGKPGKSKKGRILLVDDTPFFRMVEKDYLVSAGYEVVQAENGLKAMQVLEEEDFDAVVMDILMPKMDGWEMIDAIRSDERLKKLPVMAVTSLGRDEGLAQRGFEAGFNEWESKLDKSSLLEKLAGILG